MRKFGPLTAFSIRIFFQDFSKKAAIFAKSWEKSAEQDQVLEKSLGKSLGNSKVLEKVEFCMGRPKKKRYAICCISEFFLL
jgi:hypothetical protein